MEPGLFDPSELSGAGELVFLLLAALGILLVMTAFLWLWDRWRGQRD